MECHGGRLMECHDDRKKINRESNIALQDLEKTAPSTRAARGEEGSEWCWETTRPRAARERACGGAARGSARGQANKLVETVTSSSSRVNTMTNQGITLRRRCGYGARGARLTHSQAATPESENSSSRQASTRG